ncbi:hypothetical protein SpCBS45565_g04130 [Spizellomyces sp. 'palustris']|nr:hypothetical protein SpCBS45565_g04130 [Spizellomyces sp. 'palustris']
MHCDCYPGRMLCGDGLDLTEWFASDDPEEGGPVGPATLQCEETETHEGELPDRKCTFSESHMNNLISTFFGDDNIKLACPLAGECVRASQIPGAPGVPGDQPPDGSSGFSPLFIGLMCGGAAVLLASVFGGIWWAREQTVKEFAGIYEAIEEIDAYDDEDDENGTRRAAMMSHHTPAEIMFRDVSYLIDRSANLKRKWWWPFTKKGQNSATTTHSETQDGNKLMILDGVQGIVRPGEVMAIMGGSGAGKTTFLDILARKNKSGIVAGEVLVNGKFMGDEKYRSIIGYVDQEDTLMDTLTVYETIMYSALLRLPRTMSPEAKRARVMETMMELDILHIANRRIGSAGTRGISGGEKRRVSIACELVTGASVLFLDEPTSGLDAFNAYNVIECLVHLARTYHRTIILTIHQPRSNIYALFDKLVLLARGKMVYSGPAQEQCRDFFNTQGFVCPVGFNIADYLVDLTMHVANEVDTPPQSAIGSASEVPSPTDGLAPVCVPVSTSSSAPSTWSSLPAVPRRRRSNVRLQQETDLFTPHKTVDEEDEGVGMPNGADADTGGETSSLTPVEELKPLLPLPNERYSVHDGHTLVRAASKQSLASKRGSIIHGDSNRQLRALVAAYGESQVGVTMARTIDEVVREANARQPAPTVESSLDGLSNHVQRILNTKTHHRATLWTQFRILSSRTLKHLYRNPDLLRTHYIISVVVAICLGLLFWKVDLSLSGFQNRMGVLFFVCSVFGFGCLSSMQVFASERLIFMRERANGYYSPVTYFMSKVLFDLIPLRVIPPILLGLISYHMIGLRADNIFFLLRFLLVLVLFNLTAAACCLAISIIISDSGVATLVATLVMLFEMLFGGMLLNKATIPRIARWACHGSFFNAGWEALMVNEVNGLMLYETKFGLKINVPGTLILQTFGLNAQGYWGDVVRLGGMLGVLLFSGFLWLAVVVKERR